MHTNDGAPHVLHSLAFRSKLLLCFQFKLPEILPLWWTFFLHLCVLLSLSRNNCFDSHSIRSIEAAVQDNCSRHSHSYSSPVARFLFLSGHTSPELGIVLCYLPAPNPSAPLPKKRLNYWSLKFGRTNFQKLRESRLSTHAELHLRTHPRERERESQRIMVPLRDVNYICINCGHHKEGETG